MTSQPGVALNINVNIRNKRKSSQNDNTTKREAVPTPQLAINFEQFI